MLDVNRTHADVHARPNKPLEATTTVKQGAVEIEDHGLKYPLASVVIPERPTQSNVEKRQAQ
jgi:hypothetical protein